MEFSLLLAGHFLADIGLQPDWVLKEKFKLTRLGVVALIGHCYIHFLVIFIIAFCVGFVDFYFLALLVGVTHFVIDLGKIRGKYGVFTDQLLHYAVIVFCVIWFN